MDKCVVWFVVVEGCDYIVVIGIGEWMDFCIVVYEYFVFGV